MSEVVPSPLKMGCGRRYYKKKAIPFQDSLIYVAEE